MLTDHLSIEFNKIKAHYGQNSLNRIETMLTTSQDWRDPLQKEAKYVMPGLKSIPWRELDEYPEIEQISKQLELLYPKIKEEVNRLIYQPSELGSYDHYKVSLADWKALYIFQHGKPIEKSKLLAPITYKFYMDHLKDLLCPLGEMHFSILKSGVKIPPHSDLWNFSLNLHFAVKIPKKCGIRVANETKNWNEGKCLLFDYSFEHEAWNNSNENRVCLLMDLWNPELTLAEREAIIALITEIRKLMSIEE